MTTAMILAHLVGDYILQWNQLAQWKSRELKGVAVHCLIVLAVTWLFSLPFDPHWWPWVLFIGGLHFVIDAGQLLWQPRLAPLARFTLDQAAHFGVILLALVAGGAVDVSRTAFILLTFLQDEQQLLYLLGYAFVTMPAWVVVKFVAYGLVNGSGPNSVSDSNRTGAHLCQRRGRQRNVGDPVWPTGRYLWRIGGH